MDHNTDNPTDRQGVRLRDQHAELTRRAILDAARAVFRERGYPQTSVRVLAERAGVAVQTIYAAFGSKAGVLRGLADLFDQDPAVRGLIERLARADDPEELVALPARILRELRERGGDVIRMLRAGTFTDPEMAEVFEAAFSRHREAFTNVCRKLAERGHLRPGLTLESAIGTALAVSSLDAWEELVDRRGWTHDQYDRWLRDTLRVALLGPTPEVGRPEGPVGTGEGPS